MPVLGQAEFLIGMNYWRIGEKKFKDSFNSVTLTGDGEVRRGLSPRSDWSPRLGAAYLAEVRHVVKGVKNAKFSEQMQQLDAPSTAPSATPSGTAPTRADARPAVEEPLPVR